MKNSILLLEEYLSILDDSLQWWDGIQISERENAEDVINKFFKWSKEKYPNEAIYNN